MATIEKLMKSWEALKHLPTQLTDEIASRRKEKISLCVTTADTFCSSPGLKSGGVNVMLLSFAMESLLQMCNDSDSDVRMTADESLNRIIRQALMDSNVMKVQVELHKEIKRNGNARSLRAALWRFAYLSHMIRPQKGKPYVNNLVPCLIQISKRSEEPVQETLANAMPQIFKALGLFTTDKDVKELLKAFLLNLSSDSAQVRRTAASCIVSICQNCRKPKAFIMETLNTLVDSVIPIKENQAVPEILGVLGCLRAVLPQISMVDAEHSGQEELQGSFGVKRGHNRSTHSTDCMVQVYELSIHFSRHADHNVVNAALELLHQLLLSPPSGLIPILLAPHGISRSKILPSSSELSPFQRRSLSQMSVAGSIPPCDENSLLELDSDLPTAMSAAVSAPLLERWIQDGSSAPVESLPLQHTAPSKSNVARLQLLDAADPSEPDLTFVPEHDNFGSPAADVISTDSSPDDVRENYLLESLDQETELAHQNTPPPSASGVSLASSPGANQAEAKYQVCDIGSLTDGSIPLVYCARHLATSFLLTGYPGYRMPDRNVRVSVKALALNCVAAIVRLHPNVFQLYLDKDPISPSRRSSASSSSSQPLCELLLFAKHTDPQLRAICCTLLAGLVRSVLVQSGGNWQSWQRKADAKVSACLALPRLMQFLIQGLEDESSTTCRQTLVALAQCLPELLRSRDCHEVQLILNTLSNLAKNPYWLVKVKLLELVCELPYVVIHFVVGSSTFQDKVLHGILFDLLSDEDSRVRKAASESIVRIIPNLYHLIDRQNVSEVIAVASDDSESQLSHLLVDSEPTSATIGRTYQKIPRLDNLFTPFDSWNNIEMKSQHHCSVEASLSRVVDSLSHLLLESSSKHLTLGCCETLSVLAENYPPALYINGWSCLYYPNPSTTSNTKRDTKHVVGDGISLVNFSPASGLLHTILGLLMTSPTTLELGAQQWLNSLSGNLFCGVAVANMHPIESPPPGLKLEPNPYPNQLWSMFKDRQICIAAESLLLHVMRTLNIISHILEDSHPTTSGSKPGLPSLSPIKRHGSSAGRTTTNESPNENKAGRGMSPIKNIIHGEKEDKSDEKKSGKSTLFGSFANNQHYLKYYDLLRSSYSNYKMSLELEICDKFVGLLSSTLKVLSQLLEVMTLVEAGRIAEELLFYLRGTMSLSPTATVSCVSQLLKCVVGMNLVSFWGERSSENESKHCYPVSTISRKENGFYFNCFQKPYQQLVQFLTAASAAKPLSVEVAGVIGNYRLRADAKTGCRMADTTYLASYIRLFEPMVIESLQQYTVTSDIQLQVKVLALLTQLVQLRVNYCLLDSDMVFISFIQKQFEFIEEGQISNAEDLIMCIFHFMVLLSFEKHHSKSITTIPKVIQLCDGLMASGQNPLTHCIPALLPVVEHGFLYKSAGSLSTIDTEELETQREFMVAMLLRLVEYHQVMKLLSVVLVECRSWPDGEERWRRWSRQVCDAVLGHLTSGRLRLDSCDAQKSLHQLLLHSLAPSVFRPVDPLLRVLFSPPPHVDSSLQSVIRWLGTVIAVMLVLVAQGKEETTLTRLEEMEIALPALFFRGDTVHLASPDPLNAAAIATSPLSTSTPQLTFARLVLRVIGLVSERIDSIVMDPASSSELLKECHYLEELLAHFLMICIHMFQSGSHCKIASAAVELVAGHATEDSLLLEDANAVFLELAPACPLLMFLWCYLLTLLNYGNHAFWARVLPLPKENSKKDEVTQRHQSLSINVELVRTGATIVYCDFMCENSGESEQLQWLLSTQMLHIIELSSEAPVQELIAVLHRNPDHSSFMLQAIQKNNFPLNKATTVVRLLKCLEGVHPACSGALLLLLADHFIGHAHPALARRAAQLCTRQAEYLLTLSPPQVAEQLSREQLRDVLHSLHHSHLDRKHSGLISILNKLGSQCLALSPLETDQVRPLTPTSIQSMKLDKEWYLSQVKLRCSQTSSTGVAVEESTQLLGHLDVEDAVSVLSSPDTHLSILQLCFRHGTHQTLQAHTTATQGKNVEDTLSPLYRAARMVLMQRVHHFTELVPKDHQVFLPVGRSMTDAESIYSRNLCQVIINDVQLNALFCLAASVNSYIHSLEKLCGVVPSEAAEDLVAFALLCLEAVHSLLTQDDGKGTNNAEKLKSEKRSKSLSIEAHDVPSSGKVTADKKLNTPQPYCFELGLECASRVLCEPSLGVFLDQPNRLTWLASACSAVTAVVHFVSLGEPLPAVPMNGLSEALSKPESLTIAHACHQMSTLIAWLEKSCFNKICRNVPSFLTSPIQKLIVRLARTPLLNSYVWTPPDVWKHGWDVTPGGPYQIQVPPLPTEFLQDMDVLRQFIFRVTLLGWISRQQFEETWMSLLSVLSSESNSEDIPSEEMAIETEANSVVIEAITTLLLQTLLLPIPGNPNIGHYLHCTRDFPIKFSSGSTLQKLHSIQQRLVWKEESLHGKKVYSVFDRPNLEHIHSLKRYSYGQVSVEYLQYALACSQGAAEKDLFSESVVSKYEERCKALESSGMDVNSCLFFLLDLCTQWTQPQLAGMSIVQSRPLHEALCAVLSVSDLFTEQSQWQWLLQTSLDLGRSQPAEDEILHQYIVLSQCKACAVLQPDATVYERILRSLDIALRSSFVPTVTAALHGLSYLLQGGLLIQCGRETIKSDTSTLPESLQDPSSTLPEVIRNVVTLTAEYICKKLVSNSISSVNEEPNLILWSLAFYLLDNWSRWKVDALEQAAPVILQQAISLAHPFSRSSPTLQRIISQGLERLVVSQSEALTSRLQEQVTKLAVENLVDPNPGVLFHSLQLLLSCMYRGRDSQIMVHSNDSAESDSAVNITDPEQLVQAMEKTSALFDRIKKGYPQEVELVCSVLPNLLTDFFPASEVLTKVVGEFLSQQQPHPRLLAGVVFQVFECAVAQSHLSLLQEWLVLSFSNFTQTLPVPMATWCLTCFFISASSNPWLRALFPHVQSRIGRCEFEDRKLLCLSAADFYRQLTSESQTRKFLSTFQAAVQKQPNSPYAELLASLN